MTLSSPTSPLRDAKVGTVFDGPPLHLSLPRVLAFSGGLFGDQNWPARNLHTDRAKAVEAGLADIIVSGTQFEGHLVDFLIELCGADAWFGSGTLTVRIPKSAMLDDTVRSRVTVTAIRPDSACAVYELEVSSRNQHDEPVLKGTASVRLAGPVAGTA